MQTFDQPDFLQTSQRLLRLFSFFWVSKKWAHANAITVVVILLSLLMHTQPLAAPHPKRDLNSESAESLSDLGRFWVLGELGVGLVTLSANSPEVGKTGIHLNLGGVASYYFDSLVFDGGLGWAYNRLSGSGSSGTTKVTTRAGLLELAGRYRFTPTLSAGLLLVNFFGTDVSFSEEILQSSSQFSTIGGIQGMWDVPLDSWGLRLTLSVLTDLTLSNRQAWWFNGGVQIGLPLFGPSDEEEPEEDEPEEVEPAPQETDRFKAIDDETILVVMSDKKVYFDTAKADLTARAQGALKSVSRVLIRERANWKMIEVDGHADRRGSYEYNYYLSLQRAANVGKVIIGTGIPPSRVSFKAFSYKKPVDLGLDQEALAKNRRVEIKISGVKNAQRLAPELDELWNKAMGF